jgi:uncharacterized protein YoxC
MKRNEITLPRQLVYAIGFVILVILLVKGGKSSPPLLDNLRTQLKAVQV